MRDAARTTWWSARSSIRQRASAIGLFVVVGVLFASAPAEAARSVTPPQWFACGTYHARMISIGPPRVWSSYNRPEQVTWITQIQRWNGRSWHSYGPPQVFWSTFNYYGQSVTSWSAFNTKTGGRYVNSRLNLAVRHPGYYRLAVAVNGTEGGRSWAGFVSGGHCYMR